MRYLAPIFMLLVLGLAALPAAAQPFPRGNGGQQQAQSLDRILGNVRRQQPGQLSDVQGPVDGRYRIKWLTPDGRVLWLDTDANTGQVLGVQGETPPRGGNGAPFRGQNVRPQSFDPGEPAARPRPPPVLRNDRLMRRSDPFEGGRVRRGPGNFDPGIETSRRDRRPPARRPPARRSPAER